jgi:hypothetical protein
MKAANTPAMPARWATECSFEDSRQHRHQPIMPYELDMRWAAAAAARKEFSRGLRAIGQRVGHDACRVGGAQERTTRTGGNDRLHAARCRSHAGGCLARSIQAVLARLNPVGAVVGRFHETQA